MLFEQGRVSGLIDFGAGMGRDPKNWQQDEPQTEWFNTEWIGSEPVGGESAICTTQE